MRQDGAHLWPSQHPRLAAALPAGTERAQNQHQDEDQKPHDAGSRRPLGAASLGLLFSKGQNPSQPKPWVVLGVACFISRFRERKKAEKEEPRAVPSIWLQNPAKWQLAACTSAPPPPRSPAFSTWPHAANDFCQASSMRCFWIAATFDHLASSLMSTGALHCRPCKPHKMRFGVWDADRIYAACQTVHLKRITDG